ncbi:Chromobox protein-like protein 2, partial [Nibea albiflora]
ERQHERCRKQRERHRSCSVQSSLRSGGMVVKGGTGESNLSWGAALGSAAGGGTDQARIREDRADAKKLTGSGSGRGKWWREARGEEARARLSEPESERAQHRRLRRDQQQRIGNTTPPCTQTTAGPSLGNDATESDTETDWRPARSLLEHVFVTDVTANFITVTVKESPTSVGFFNSRNH